MTGIEIKTVKFRNRFNQIVTGGKTRLFVSAIVAAAGSGERMGGVSKPLISLCGKPCIAYSLEAFQESGQVDEIIVVAKPEEVEEIQNIGALYRITKLAQIVHGGATRQESVARGFEAVHKKSGIVAIHDAARPLISTADINALIAQAKRFGAAAAASKVTDTVKKAAKNQFSEGTVPRELLYTVQTPQVFKTDLYRAALALALRDKLETTDDTALAEHAGFKVRLCESGNCNLKITVPNDLELIQALLKERRNSGFQDR